MTVAKRAHHPSSSQSLGIDLIEKMTRLIDRSRLRRFRLIYAVVFVLNTARGVIMQRVDLQMKFPDHCEEYCLGDSRFATSYLHRLTCVCPPWHYVQRMQDRTGLKYQPYHLHETMRKPHSLIRQVPTVRSKGVYFAGLNSPLDVNPRARQTQAAHQRNPTHKPENRLNLGHNASPESNYNYYNQYFQHTGQNPYHLHQFLDPKNYPEMIPSYTKSAAIEETHIYSEMAVTSSTDNEFILDVGILVTDSNTAQQIGLIDIKSIDDVPILLDSLGNGNKKEDFQKCVSLYDMLGKELYSRSQHSDSSYHQNYNNKENTNVNIYNKPIHSIRSYHADILNKCNSVVMVASQNNNSFVKGQDQTQITKLTTDKHSTAKISHSTEIYNDSGQKHATILKPNSTNDEENANKDLNILSRGNNGGFGEYKNLAAIKKTKNQFNFEETTVSTHPHEKGNGTEKDKQALKANRRSMSFSDFETEPTLTINNFELSKNEKDGEISGNKSSDIEKYTISIEANNKNVHFSENVSKPTINIFGVSMYEKDDEPSESDVYNINEKTYKLPIITESSVYSKTTMVVANLKNDEEKPSQGLFTISLEKSDRKQQTKQNESEDTPRKLLISTSSQNIVNERESGFIEGKTVLESNHRSMNWSESETEPNVIINSDSYNIFKYENDYESSETYLGKTGQSGHISSRENNYDFNKFTKMDKKPLLNENLNFDETITKFPNNFSELSSMFENYPNTLEKLDKKHDQTLETKNDNISGKTDKPRLITESNINTMPSLIQYPNYDQTNTNQTQYILSKLHNHDLDEHTILQKNKTPYDISNLFKTDAKLKKNSSLPLNKLKIGSKYENYPTTLETNEKNVNYPEITTERTSTINNVGMSKQQNNGDSTKHSGYGLENGAIVVDAINSSRNVLDNDTEPSFKINNLNILSNHKKDHKKPGLTNGVSDKNDEPTIGNSSKYFTLQSLNPHQDGENKTQAPELFSKENNYYPIKLKTQNKVVTLNENQNVKEITNTLDQPLSYFHNKTDIDSQLQNDPSGLEANYVNMNLSDIETDPTYASSYTTHPNNVEEITKQALFNISNKNWFNFDKHQKPDSIKSSTEKSNAIEAKSPDEQLLIMPKKYKDIHKILNYLNNTNITNSTTSVYFPKNDYLGYIVNKTDKDKTKSNIQTHYENSSPSEETRSIDNEDHERTLKAKHVEKLFTVSQTQINTMNEVITSTSPTKVNNKYNFTDYGFTQSPPNGKMEYQSTLGNPFIGKMKDVLKENQSTHEITHQSLNPSSLLIPDNMMGRNKMDRSWIHIYESQTATTHISKENNYGVYKTNAQPRPITVEEIISTKPNPYFTSSLSGLVKTSHETQLEDSNIIRNNIISQSIYKASPIISNNSTIYPLLTSSHNILDMIIDINSAVQREQNQNMSSSSLINDNLEGIKKKYSGKKQDTIQSTSISLEDNISKSSYKDSQIDMNKLKISKLVEILSAENIYGDKKKSLDRNNAFATKIDINDDKPLNKTMEDNEQTQLSHSDTSILWYLDRHSIYTPKIEKNNSLLSFGVSYNLSNDKDGSKTFISNILQFENSLKGDINKTANTFTDALIPDTKKYGAAKSKNIFLMDDSTNINKLKAQKNIEPPMFNNKDSTMDLHQNLEYQTENSQQKLFTNVIPGNTMLSIEKDTQEEIFEPRIFDDEDLSIDQFHSDKSDQTDTLNYELFTKTSLNDTLLSKEKLKQNEIKIKNVIDIGLSNQTNSLNKDDEVMKGLTPFKNIRRKYIPEEITQNTLNETTSGEYTILNRDKTEDYSFSVETKPTNIDLTTSGEIFDPAEEYDTLIKTTVPNKIADNRIKHFNGQSEDDEFENTTLDSQIQFSKSEEEIFNSNLKSEDIKLNSSVRVKMNNIQPSNSHESTDIEHHSIELGNIPNNNNESADDQYDNVEFDYETSINQESIEVTSVLPTTDLYSNQLHISKHQYNNISHSKYDTQNDIVPQWPYLRGRIYFVSDNVKIPLQFIQYTDGNMDISFDGIGACKDRSNIPVSLILRTICQSIKRESQHTIKPMLTVNIEE